MPNVKVGRATKANPRRLQQLANRVAEVLEQDIHPSPSFFRIDEKER